MAGTYALTALATLQTALKTTTDGAVYDRLIDVATAMIERFCQRQFLSRSYASWLDAKGGTLLYLPHYPVTAVSRIATTIRDVATVKNATANAAWATVSASTSALTLALQVGATATNSNVAYATYTTINAIVAQINTLGNSWSSVESDTATSIPSTDIKPGGAWACLDSDIYLYAPDEPQEEFEFDEDSGRLYCTSATFPKGKQNVFVAYTGGYSTIPDDLQQACIEVAQQLHQQISQDANLRAESLGDYSYTLASRTEIGADIQAKLWPHRRLFLP